jgi:hypothetical protein
MVLLVLRVSARRTWPDQTDSWAASPGNEIRVGYTLQTKLLFPSISIQHILAFCRGGVLHSASYSEADACEYPVQLLESRPCSRYILPR